MNFSARFLQLGGAEKYETLAQAKEAEVATLNYGLFINTVINVVIVAFLIFLVVKGMNKIIKKEETKPAPPAEPPADVNLLTEIRDLLKKA